MHKETRKAISQELIQKPTSQETCKKKCNKIYEKETKKWNKKKKCIKKKGINDEVATLLVFTHNLWQEGKKVEMCSTIELFAQTRNENAKYSIEKFIQIRIENTLCCIIELTQWRRHCEKGKLTQIRKQKEWTRNGNGNIAFTCHHLLL